LAELVRAPVHQYPNPDSLVGKYKRTEVEIQAEREANIIGATYFSVDEIPASPREPEASRTEGQGAETPKVMTLGSMVLADREVQEAIDWVHSPAQRTSMAVASNPEMASLLTQIAASSAGQQSHTAAASQARLMQQQPASAPMPALTGVDLKSLLATLHHNTAAPTSSFAASVPAVSAAVEGKAMVCSYLLCKLNKSSQLIETWSVHTGRKDGWIRDNSMDTVDESFSVGYSEHCY
jgi:hypothetical protein